MKDIPLRGFAASPFSHAARGKGDAASARERSAAYAAWRPLHGGSRLRCAGFKGVWRNEEHRSK